MEIVLDRQAIAADGHDSTIARLEPAPARQIRWSIAGDAAGCQINSDNGQIFAGARSAIIQIVAASRDDDTVLASKGLYVVSVTIDPIRRDEFLPASIPANSIHSVVVRIDPPLTNIEATVFFDVDNSDIRHGKVVVEGDTEAKETTMLRLRAAAINGRPFQTEPGYSGRLHVRAFLNGRLEHIARSNGFSVCSHPISVLNSSNRWVRDVENCGMHVDIAVHDDSNQPNRHMDAVLQTELLGNNVVFQGIDPHIAPSRRVWQTSNETLTDAHNLTLAKIEEIAQSGNLTKWHTDQLDVFCCARCGMQMPTVVPRSGYRVTRTVEVDPDGTVRLIVRKEPLAVSVSDYKANDGPSGVLAVSGECRP